MSEENLSTPAPEQASPDSAPEEVNPQVSFLRGLMSHVSQILRDDKSKLTGPQRLVAELIDRSGRPIASKTAYEKISAWQSQWDALQKKINDHGYDQSVEYFRNQQESLHEKAGTAEADNSLILARAEIEKRFELIRESCKDAQKKLYAENIQTARLFAAAALEILDEHVVSLDATERDKFTRYGLPYTGSPLVAAVKHAAVFVKSRTASDVGQAPPSLILPWLIL